VTVSRSLDGTIHLDGDCLVDEAETLLALLLEHPAAPVDWGRCRSAHTALVQVLLALGRPVLGRPEDPFLRRWIAPLLPGDADAEPPLPP
jgi:hypothetical protein